jgi:guanylate kinase
VYIETVSVQNSTVVDLIRNTRMVIRMAKEHVLICLMGRTASGKDTLASKLCERTGLRQVISYTTRERRTNE